jgi:hypothetical protein
MHGFVFKITKATVTLFMVFVSALTCAASTTNDPYKAKLGCMSCHQGEAHSSDKAGKEKSR